jgi:hypothetical protein
VTPASGPCRRWSAVHQTTRLHPAGYSHASRTSIWANMAGAQHGHARRVGAVACGMAGHRPSRYSALGCTGHQRASARPVMGVRTAQPSGGQKCGTQRHGGAHVPYKKWHGATAGSQESRTATASTRTWVAQELRAVDGDLTCDSAGLRLGPGRAVVCGHSRACARAASPCLLGAAVCCPEVQHEVGRWRNHHSLHNIPRLDDRFPSKILARRQRCTRA